MNSQAYIAKRIYSHRREEAIIWCLEASGKNRVSKFLRNSVFPFWIKRPTVHSHNYIHKEILGPLVVFFKFHSSQNKSNKGLSLDSLHDHLQHKEHSYTSKSNIETEIEVYVNKLRNLRDEFDPVVAEEICQLYDNRRHKSKLFSKLAGHEKSTLIKVLLRNGRSDLYDKYVKDSVGVDGYNAKSIMDYVWESVGLLDDEKEFEKHLIAIIKDDSVKNSKFLKELIEYCLHTSGNIERAINIYVDFCLKAFGYLEFTYMNIHGEYLKILSTIIYEMEDLKTIMAVIDKYNDVIKNTFLTSCMAATLHSKKAKYTTKFWELKVDAHKTTKDLTLMLSACNKLLRYEETVGLYKSNPHLHEDEQFDSIIEAYGNLSKWSEMQSEFEGLFGQGDLPNIVHYGIVMYILARRGEVSSVDRLWAQLNSRKILPSVMTFAAVMESRFYYGDYDAVFELFKQVRSHGIAPHSHLFLIIFRTLRRTGDLDTSVRLLSELVRKKFQLSSACLNTVLYSCMDINNYDAARSIWRLVQAQRKDVHLSTYKAMMEVCLKCNHEEEFQKLFQKARALYGKKLDLFILLLRWYGKKGDIRKGSESYFEMVKSGIEPNHEYYAAMITYFCEIGNYESAESLLKAMYDTVYKPNQSHYYALMRGLLKSNQHERIFVLYDEILKHDIIPDIFINDVFLKSVIREGSLISAKAVFESIVSQGFRKSSEMLSDTVVYTFIKAIIEYEGAKSALGYLNMVMSQTKAIKIPIIRSLIIISGEDDNTEDVKKYFDTLYDTVMGGVTTNPTLKKVKNQRAFYDVYKYEAISASKRNAPEEVLSCLKVFSEKKVFLSNNDWNEAVICLLSHTSHFIEGLKVIEEKLINGFIMLSARSQVIRQSITSSMDPLESATEKVLMMKKPFYYLQSQPLVYEKLQSFIEDTLVGKTILQADSEEECLTILKEKFPNTMRNLKKSATFFMNEDDTRFKSQKDRV